MAGRPAANPVRPFVVLGLTQAELATLLGVSYLSVHKWEGGKAQPRAVQLQKIAAVMKMGKREAAKQLQA